MMIFGFGPGKRQGGGRFVWNGRRFVRPETLRRSRRRRAINIAHDPFKRHFSYQHCRRLTNWSEYHAANKELGLVDTGRKAEMHKVEMPDSPKRGRFVEDS